MHSLEQKSQTSFAIAVIINVHIVTALNMLGNYQQTSKQLKQSLGVKIPAKSEYSYFKIKSVSNSS